MVLGVAGRPARSAALRVLSAVRSLRPGYARLAMLLSNARPSATGPGGEARRAGMLVARGYGLASVFWETRWRAASINDYGTE
jgi:hypothetical protein